MRNADRETVFRFKQFDVVNRQSAMKVGTDGVLLGAWAASAGNSILDVGAGTGLIALMMAQRFPDAEVTAVEIDPVAVQEAAANFSASPWNQRLTAICADFTSWISPDRKFDAIVSNPPFFTAGLRALDSSRAAARHCDTLPLPVMFSQSYSMLAPEGVLSLILPQELDSEIEFMAVTAGLYPSRRCHVTTTPRKPAKRTLWEFSMADGPCRHSELSITDGNGAFTPEYISLTRDFYLTSNK